MIKSWLIWLIFGAILLVAEIFTAGFFLLWFGIAAGIAGLLALAGFPYAVQWGAFIVLSIVLFIFSRPLAEKMTKKQPPGIGADRLLGKEGIVIQEISNSEGTGIVRIKGDEWRADSATGEVIHENDQVVVTGIEGTHVIVRRVC